MSLVKRCISVHLKVESVIAWDCHEIKECSMQCLTYLCSKVCRQNRSKKGHYKKTGNMEVTLVKVIRWWLRSYRVDGNFISIMSGLYIVHGIVELKTSFDHLAMIYDIRMIYEAKRNAYFLNPLTKMLPFHVLCCRTFVWLKFFSSHHQSFWISF